MAGLDHIYWLNPTTASLVESPTVTDVADIRGGGVFTVTLYPAPSIAACGYLITATFNTAIDGTCFVGGGASYLRQRQSPVRAPSRIRPPQVRQRQRPEVTT